MNMAKEYAGRWPGILMALGLDERQLRNTHGPCPICGGKDRFRFDNKNGEGTYYCNHCGAGDATQLLCKVFGWDFKTMANNVREVAGEVVEQPFKPPETVSIEQRRKTLNSMWARAKQDSVALAYLRSRGLERQLLPRTMRGIGSMYHRDSGTHQMGVVSLIQNPAGEPVSLHRIFLMPDGSRDKKIMPPISTISGGAIRLGGPQPGEEILHVAEGVESALAVQDITGSQHVWATISAQGMEALEVPKEVTEVVIWADNDESYTGQAAAYALAKRLTVKEGKWVAVKMPQRMGMDPLDQWQATKSLGQAS
jgi:putative DNA primase/helicase